MARVKPASIANSAAVMLSSVAVSAVAPAIKLVPPVIRVKATEVAMIPPAAISLPNFLRFRCFLYFAFYCFGQCAGYSNVCFFAF